MKFTLLNGSSEVPVEQIPAVMKGEDGKSAYQHDLDAGFVGTEAEWLASLRGADGRDGRDGTDVVGSPGKDGSNAIITVVSTQAAYDAATPRDYELVVLI